MANLCIKHEFDTKNKWVFEYDVTVDYHKDTLVHYKDDKIYQSYDCEKNYILLDLILSAVGTMDRTINCIKM